MIPENAKERNVVLIGMPGVGKSTVGVLLAKITSRNFIDTDVYIQAREKRRLQEILDTEGREAFCRIEERHVLSAECAHCVIATGGSIIYSDAAMEHLKRNGVVVHMDLPVRQLKKRLANLDSRGVVMIHGQTLQSLYDERLPLYNKWADCTIDCRALNHEEAVAKVISRLKLF